MSKTLFRHKMTDGEKQQVVNIYQHVKSIRAINQAYGFSKRSRIIKRALQEYQVEILVGKRKIPTNQEEEIIKKYLTGASTYSLSEEYSISVPAICYLLDRNNIKRRDNKVLSIEDEKRVVKQYLSGASVQKVGQDFNIAPTTVPNILERHSHNTRSAGYNSRIYKLNEHFFNNLNNEYVAYILGFVYADGGISKETLNIALSTKDLNHLEKIKTIIGYEAPIQLYKTKTPQGKLKDTCRLSVHSKIVTIRLKELGIIAKRGQFYKLEKQLPKQSYKHFIRGFVDGDGCLDTNGRTNARLRILGQEDILTWIMAVFQSELKIPLKKLRIREGILELEYGGSKQARKAIRWLYQDNKICLERKINKMIWFNKKQD